MNRTRPAARVPATRRRPESATCSYAAGSPRKMARQGIAGEAKNKRMLFPHRSCWRCQRVPGKWGQGQAGPQHIAWSAKGGARALSRALCLPCLFVFGTQTVTSLAWQLQVSPAALQLCTSVKRKRQYSLGTSEHQNT